MVAYRPFSPFREPKDLRPEDRFAVREPSKLDDMHWRWRWRAELYKALPYPPAEIDQMEIWQVAVLLGTDKISDSDWEPTEGDIRRMEQFSPTDERDLTAQVMAQMGINPG